MYLKIIKYQKRLTLSCFSKKKIFSFFQNLVLIRKTQKHKLFFIVMVILKKKKTHK